jgi:hypothetical protein
MSNPVYLKISILFSFLSLNLSVLFSSSQLKRLGHDRIQIFWRKKKNSSRSKEEPIVFWTLKMSLWWAVALDILQYGKGGNFIF